MMKSARLSAAKSTTIVEIPEDLRPGPDLLTDAKRVRNHRPAANLFPLSIAAVLLCSTLVSLPACGAFIFPSMSSEVEVQAKDTGLATHIPYAWPFPYQTTDSVTAPGGSTSSAIYDLNTAFLRWDFSQSTIASSGPSGVATLAFNYGYVYFQVATDTPYVLSGHHEMVGNTPNNTNYCCGQFDHWVRLYDAIGTTLFEYDFVSHQANAVSDLSGPGLAGILLAHHSYSLSYQSYIANGLRDGYGPIGSGFLKLQTVTQPNRPHIDSATLSGASVVGSGSGGQTNGTYYLLTSTNPGLPLTNWTLLATNAFDGTGHFTFTDVLSPAVPQRFYIIRLP